MQALGLTIGGNGGPGELHIGQDALVRITQSLFIGQNGKVTGSGVFDIDGASVVNYGLIEPGNSPGVVEFGADFEQGPTGLLHIELAGSQVAGVDYDLILVDGNLILDGTLCLDFIEGFSPIQGDVYDLIQLTPGHQLTGDLADLEVQVSGLNDGWQYSLTYVPSERVVRLSALTTGANSSVPEPTSLPLISVGAAFLLRRRRRVASVEP
jgi:hypothetical protein